MFEATVSKPLKNIMNKERGQVVVAKVAAMMRNTDSLRDLVEKYGDAVLPLRLGVTDRDQVFAAVAATHKHFGRLDVSVTKVGFGLFGTVEEITEQ